MKLKNNIIKTRLCIRIMPVAFLFLFCILGYSCKKFVDKERNTFQPLLQTADDCQQVLDNYNVMNTNYPSDGEVSADNYYINDAGYLNSTLGSTDRDLYIWASGAIRLNAQPQWQAPYNVVYNANLVLESADNLKTSVSKSVLDGIRGQALFFRAYALWNIAQLYAKPYVSSTAAQDLGIPLYLSSNVSGNTDRGSLQQTYTRIVQDLQDAVSLLGTSSIASRPSKGAAYAMLARVYLSMEDYTQALANANSALLIKNTLISFGTLNTTSPTPFARFNAEVYFHSVIAPVPNLNPGIESSNMAKIDPALVTSYAANDLRSKIFLKANTGADAGTFRFTGNYEPAISAVLFNGLAVDEMYLTRAECYARAGNFTSAMADLNTLLSTRWTSGTYVNMTSTTAADALSKVLTERRKELLMRGQRWTDLRRLNRDLTFAKTLTRTVSGTTYTLPPNDIRYTLLIPNEVIVNSNFSIQQNPR